MAILANQTAGTDPTTGKSYFTSGGTNVNPSDQQAGTAAQTWNASGTYAAPKPNSVEVPGMNTTTPPSGTAVITPAAAVADVNKIQTAANNMQAGMTQQSQTNTANQQASATYTPPATSSMSFSDKAVMAGQRGIANYTGTAQQDALLQQKLNDEMVQQQEIAKKGGGYLAETGTTTPQTDQAMTNVRTAAQTQLDTIDATTKATNANLASYLAGTIPLTPDQQAQVNAMQQKMESTRQAQIIANQQYQGAVTQAGIRSGRNVYAPGIEAGNIQTAVSAGLAKLNDLDATSAAALASLKQGFEDKNYTAIKDAYTQINDLTKQRADVINSVYDKVAAYEKNINDTINKQKKDFYDQVTKPIQDIAEEAEKNGATGDIVQKILASKTPLEALNTAAANKSLIGKKETSVVEINNRKVLIDNQTGTVVKDLGPISVTPKTPTEASLEKEDINSMAGALEGAAGEDGYVSPTDYKTAKKAWVKAGRKSKDFDTTFSVYRNPNDTYSVDQ